MNSNELNRRLRYALMLDDAQVMDLFALVSHEASPELVAAWRLKEGESGFLVCPAQAVKCMLDGLIIQRRGVRENADARPENKKNTALADTGKQSEDAHTLDNNLVLKQLKIALMLKTDDMLALVKEGGGSIGKGELGAFLRNPSARNYRRCGDQALRWFLNGLASRRQATDISGKKA